MEKKRFNIGIVGLGSMAAKMVKVISGLSEDNIFVTAVASKDIDRANEFAQKYCKWAKPYGSYEEIANDSDLDLIYIATTNNMHYECALLCLVNGKNVLIEKPFVLTPEESLQLLIEAKQRNLYIGEAMWTDYMPLNKVLLDWIKQDKIGNVKLITANIGYDVANNERITSQELGGGSYYDLGVYTTNFALNVLGDNLRVEHVYTSKFSTGTDRYVSYILVDDDKKCEAVFFVTASAEMDKHGAIIGDQGRIEITNVNNYERIFLFDKDNNMVEECVRDGDELEGYRCEIRCVVDAIRKHYVQSPEHNWERIRRLAQLNAEIMNLCN